MVELIIQVPNELAQRLEPIRDRLPELLTQIAAAMPLDSTQATPVTVRSTSVEETAYTEIIDFLSTSSTLQEIATFKVSNKAQLRLRTLLERNCEGTLTDTEQAELDLYEQIEHIMILLKTRAYAALT